MTTTSTEPEAGSTSTEVPERGRPLLPGRLLRGARPWLFLAGVVAPVWVAGLPDYDPQSSLYEYALRATVVVLVLIGAAAWWWSARRHQAWGFDLIPALLGAVGGLALVGSLNGTPYAPGGLAADQSFRTAAITRFADSWHNADFTFQGLPSFYAPAYFWLLGRAADLASIEAWRMAKYGTVLVMLLVPLVTYLLWRRLVPIGVAALIAAVPLLVENFYEPYAWLVLFAIVPWWLEAVHGLRRPGRPHGNLLFLGLVGGLLFMTYYYFFFIAAIALLIHVVTERLLGEIRWRQLVRGAAVLALAAVTSAVYWLPLAISILRAEHPQSLANRWFNTGHPSLPLPMLEFSAVGAVTLVGLVFLVWTVRREPLSRGLVVFLAAAYCWYIIGAAAAIADTPLLSFRGKPLIPMILLIAGILGLVRIGSWALQRFSTADVRRLVWVIGIILVIYAGQSMVSAVRGTSLMEGAHDTALPDTPPPDPPPAELQRAITDRFRGTGNPVLLSDRIDILVLYPNYGFLQWNAHYAHPAAEFGERAAFLARLSTLVDPAEFAARSADNRFDRIDVFVLAVDGDDLVYRYAEDAFPGGVRGVEVRFPRTLFSPAAFDLLPAGDHLLAVRRP